MPNVKANADVAKNGIFKGIMEKLDFKPYVEDASKARFARNISQAKRDARQTLRNTIDPALKEARKVNPHASEQEIRDKVAEAIQNGKKKRMAEINAEAKKGYADSKYMTTEDNLLSILSATKQYYNPKNGQSAGTMALRYGTTLGGYALGAMGIRALAGGTPTTNANGDRDIAGIPFI